MQLRERNIQIDVSRGIAILIVVLGHCFYTLNDPVNKIILSFHMPLFFFLSGLVTRTAANQGISTIGFIKRKLKAFLLPQLVLGVLSYVYYGMFIVIMKGGNLKEIPFLYQFWRYWFLQVLFSVSIIFYFISKVIDVTRKRNSVLLLIVSFIVACIFSYVIPFPDEMPLYINVVPMSLVFYFMGFILKNQFIKDGLFSKKICLLSIIPLVSCAVTNSSVTMYNNNYGNIVLFMISAGCGIVFIWLLSKLFSKSRFLAWCGKNSIIIYVWQFILTQFMKNVVEIVVEKVYPDCPTRLMTITAFGLCVLILIPIVFTNNLICPEIYGKNRNG